MTTDHKHIDISGISVEIIRKEIKNLHVGVYPPHGRVRVAAPLRLRDDAIRLSVISRLGWIRRKQEGFLKQDRQTLREMVTGESHYYLGRRYLLDVIETDGPPRINLLNNTTMRLQVRPGMNREARTAFMQRWYRQRLREQIPELLAKWEPKVGRKVADLRIKRMKTRWGSCSVDAGRVWLNLELIKKPISCLEYILVHEMVHLIERHHTERFQELMTMLMPTWKICRDELNRAPLAHEDWDY